MTGKRVPKYVSIIPKVASHLNAYQLFTKEVYPKIVADYPHFTQGEKVSKAGAMWREVTAEDQAKYKREADGLKHAAHRAFVDDEANRDELRRQWCARLGLSKHSSWQIVDEHHRAEWNKIHNINTNIAPPSSSTSAASAVTVPGSTTVTATPESVPLDMNNKKRPLSEQTSGDVNTTEDRSLVSEHVATESEAEGGGTIAANKGRRAASAAATQKLDSLMGLSFPAQDLVTRDDEVSPGQDSDQDLYQTEEEEECLTTHTDSQHREKQEKKIKPEPSEHKPRKRVKTASPTASSSSSGGGGSMMSSAQWKTAAASVAVSSSSSAAGDTGTSNDGTGDINGGGLKMNKSRLGDEEWQQALWGEDRVQAVTKALDRVYDMSLSADNFSLFGNDMIQCFYDVSTVTGEPIRSKTLKYVEHLANRWKYTVMQEGWKKGARPHPCEVIEVVTGMYCMERVGIRHDLKEEVLTFLSTTSDKAYTARDYYGWDPLGPEGLPCEDEEGEGGRGYEVISNATVSRYRLFSSSLIHSFYADRVGLILGCPFVEIFKWLPTLRPYKGPTELTWQDYIDQCYLVTHIIFTANNWGELRLAPALFPHEYFFLRHHLAVHLHLRDVHLIAEFVESLRCFGCTDDDPLIRQGMRALLDSQSVQGIWDDTDNTDPYRTYHATMCGAQALLAHNFRGFGPGIPAILPLLTQWSEEDKDTGSGGQARAAVLEKTREAVTLLHQQVRQQRADPEDSSYVPVPLFTSPYEYVEQLGSENLFPSDKNQNSNRSRGQMGEVLNNIHQPVCMPAHVEERLATLKQAIRGFAKKTASDMSGAAGPAAVTTSAAADVATSSTATSITTSSAGCLSASDVDTLTHLGALVTAFLVPCPPSSSPLSTAEDTSLLLQTLQQAEFIPVTAAVLQSGRFSSLAKQVRQVSKLSSKRGADGTNTAVIKTLLSSVTTKAAEVVSQWKQSVLVTSTAGSPHSISNSEDIEKTDDNKNEGDGVAVGGGVVV